MAAFTGSNPSYFIGRTDIPPSVKTEASASPDLSPAPTSVNQFHFKYHPLQQQPSHDPFPSPANHSDSPAWLPPLSLYRFGAPVSPYNLLPTQHSWPASQYTSTNKHTSLLNGNTPSPQNGLPSISRVSAHNNNTKYGFGASQPAMSYSDEYDTVSELADLPLDNLGGVRSSSAASNDRTVRRRSSKACDQCRKSKCKCERSGPNEPCKSCIMLGTQCTFLGPSRKRGPPKGYIDAIEARLHQTEALLGILLATGDQRAKSLLRDIAKDPLAKEIIARVDDSPYGVKGRKRDENTNANKARSTHTASPAPSTSENRSESDSRLDLASMHPSTEWQDRVSSMLDSTLAEGVDSDSQNSSSDQSAGTTFQSSSAVSSTGRPILRVDTYSGNVASTSAIIPDEFRSPNDRRQRRRLGNEDLSLPRVYYDDVSPVGRADRFSERRGIYAPPSRMRSSLSLNPDYADRYSLSADSLSSDSEDELPGAIGQLSLNEDEQVRYHGKASGLYLLGTRGRVNSRNQGGIWRFPKARVWPPLRYDSTAIGGDDEFSMELPNRNGQEHLLNLYFRYVHPCFPILHKRSFFDIYNAGSKIDSPHSQESDNSTSPFNRRRERMPTLLLLAMFAVAARYDDTTKPSPSDGSMWAAGDEYRDRAKIILDGIYSSSRPSTCQALLLMGYREIGIGAMAEAWTYIGMAIRMAQDLGMHRSADGWARVDLGGPLFSQWELDERKRIWYGCVIMDKYVSTYIGRPLMIFERDFDTLMPNENESEELDEWPAHVHDSMRIEQPQAVHGYIISCFNSSASLSGILSMIVQAIYAVRLVSSRHSESRLLEGLLDKWYLKLPEHLRYDPRSSKQPTPLPHVLTLHMQYWCAVLLLHRPFIRNVYTSKHKQSDDADAVEVRAIAEKSYELCAAAANHIATIVTAYAEKHSLSRCSVFLCYYVFTASIMHITSLTTHPADPQARIGLNKCMDALQMMETVWPSAARALELLRGAEINLDDAPLCLPAPSTERFKRPAEQSLDDSFHSSIPSDGSSESLPMRVESVPSTYVSHDVYAAGYPSQPSSDIPTTSGSIYRWPTENLTSRPFSGPLSTSVLPQLYSTGLVDGASSSTSSHREQSHADQHGHAPVSRYPQFWNDYSTFPQLGTAYGGVHEQGTTNMQSSASQMYMSDQQYSIYS